MQNKVHLLGRIASLFCVLAAMNLHAETAMPDTPSPTVIELFTSQGCNSCPPAEALLGEYASNPNVLLLAFHVDYWDYLGWRDPFALPISKQRQRGYVQSLQLSSAFTPQSIVNGQLSMVGSDRRRLQSALGEKVHGVHVMLAKTNNTLTITLPEAASKTAFDIQLITYQKEASTSVPRGENAGNTLKEHNVVRSFQTLPRWNGQATHLNESLTNIPSGANRVAVIVQHINQGAIVGAATLTL